MAAVKGVYGFQPVNRLDGSPYAGATREYPIADGYATKIHNGDLVDVTGTGTIVRSAALTGSTTISAVTTIGVFVGCEYVNAEGQVVHSQYYPATGTNIKAKIVVDPSVVFKVAIGSASGVVGVLAAADRFATADLFHSAGVDATGRSGVSLSETVGTAATKPTLVVGFVEDSVVTQADVDSGDFISGDLGKYTEALVVLNGGHRLRLAASGTGV